MAIELKDKPGVAAPTAGYPYGKIKDDTGVGDGTPVSEAVYDDHHQFFARLLALSAITPNGQPDNATNGFQLYEAFVKLVAGGLPGSSAGAWMDAGVPTLTPDTGTVSVFSTIYNKYKVFGKTMFWQVQGAINVNSGSPTAITVSYPPGITPVAGGAASSYKMVIGYHRDSLTMVTFTPAGAVIKRYPDSAFAGTSMGYTFSCVIEIQ